MKLFRDGDLHGDACDNCKDVKNVDQLDTDNDGLDLNFLHLFSKYA